MELLKFSRPGCVPCKMVGNYLDSQKVDYKEVNVYQETELAQQYKLQSVPVLILINDNGDIVDQTIGYNPPEIDELLKQYK